MPIDDIIYIYIFFCWRVRQGAALRSMIIGKRARTDARYIARDIDAQSERARAMRDKLHARGSIYIYMMASV